MQTAKECLQQIRKIDNLIDCQISEVERLREMLTRVTPVLDRDGSSGGGFHDKIASGVAKIVDIQNEINKSVDAYADTKATLLDVLRRMNHPDYVQVLHKRYFLYETWEEIAADMKYSYRGICYLHGRALQEFERIMKKEDEKKDGTAAD